MHATNEGNVESGMRISPRKHATNEENGDSGMRTCQNKHATFKENDNSGMKLLRRRIFPSNRYLNYRYF
jgi:hypothetical protein